MKNSYKIFRYDAPLLERLRNDFGLNNPHTHAMLEAADEIERLLEENEKLRNLLGSYEEDAYNKEYGPR